MTMKGIVLTPETAPFQVVQIQDESGIVFGFVVGEHPVAADGEPYPLSAEGDAMITIARRAVLRRNAVFMENTANRIRDMLSGQAAITLVPDLVFSDDCSEVRTTFLHDPLGAPHAAYEVIIRKQPAR